MNGKKYLIPSVYIHLFFLLGLLSTLAIRLIIIVEHIDTDLIRPVWYIGVVGYIIFFAYRYYITKKRRELILKHDLISKINHTDQFDENDKEVLYYILSSIIKSKENINYLFIFASSTVAIIIDFVLEAL